MKAMTELLSWMKKRSSASNELARKAEAELTALRNAGGKMADALRDLRKASYYTAKDAAALEAWEAANK